MHSSRLIRLSSQLKRATVGRVEACDDVEERGFAGAVRANQAIHLTAFNGHVDIGQSLQAAKSFGDACNF